MSSRESTRRPILSWLVAWVGVINRHLEAIHSFCRMQSFACQSLHNQCHQCLWVAPHPAATPLAPRALAQPLSFASLPRVARNRQWKPLVQAAAGILRMVLILLDTRRRQVFVQRVFCYRCSSLLSCTQSSSLIYLLLVILKWLVNCSRGSSCSHS